MHRTSLWDGGVRIAGLALLFTLLSTLPSRADLAPKWSDAELLGFSDVVVTGTVAAVATGWDARTVYTYVTLDVGEVIKGWIPERQIILKLLGGRVDDLALIVGGQAAFTVGEHVLVFLEARRGDRTLATTALWQGKWTISTDSVSGQRLATRRLPSTPDRRAFGLAVDVRALEPWMQTLRAQAGQTSRAPTGAEPAVIVQPREARAARRVFDVDATAVMNGVWHDRDRASSSRTVATADCFTRFRESAVMSSATGDPCGDMGAGGGTLAIGGYWARAAVGAPSGPVEPFMQIVQSGAIANAGAGASTYLSQPTCADQISAHELAHARGRSHTEMATALLDRSCAAPRVWVESRRDASIRAAVAAESATVTGSSFTLAWDAPDSGGAPTTYVIEAGSAPGLADLARFATGGAGTSYPASAVAPGTYYVRIRAANDGGISPPSNEISVTVVPTGSTPNAPMNLAATALGSTVTLAWTAPAGSAASDYRIEAGSAPGLSDLANFATGSPATSFMATGVGAGTFFIRVRAVSAAGAGPASNEVRLLVTGASVPCIGAPGAPGGFTALVTGSTVTLAWNAGAGMPTSYLIEAGSSAGATNLALFDTASTSPSLQVTGVGGGEYFVRVRAKNACGASPPSNEVLVTVR